jgi:hypothetical protein
MKINWRKTLLVAGLATAVAFPFIANADSLSINFGGNIGADDQVHYNFNDTHHHPELWKAAKDLQGAKHRLWEARKHHNFGGHAESSIKAINAALDEIKRAEDFAWNHGGW